MIARQKSDGPAGSRQGAVIEHASHCQLIALAAGCVNVQLARKAAVVDVDAVA
jgi:hypothetical protein